MTFPVDYDKFTILSKVRNEFTIRTYTEEQILRVNLLIYIYFFLGGGRCFSFVTYLRKSDLYVCGSIYICVSWIFMYAIRFIFVRLD